MKFRNIRYILFITLINIVVISGCSGRDPKIVEVGPNYYGYVLLVNKPIPTNPDKAKNYNFEYVGKVDDGTTCLVTGVANIDRDLLFEVDCEGLSEPGWIPADAVKIIEYFDE